MQTEEPKEVPLEKSGNMPSVPQPNPSTIQGIFEHYARTERGPTYTPDQLRDLLSSVGFIKRVASSRALSASFLSFDDRSGTGAKTGPELTAATLSAVIAGFADEYLQHESESETEGNKPSKLPVDLKFEKKALAPSMVKQLEEQDFEPGFAPGPHGEARIEVVAQTILKSIEDQLAFEDLKAKGSIYRWMTLKDFPQVLHYAVNDSLSTIDKHKKATFNRLFSGDMLRAESLKLFLLEVDLSESEVTAIVDCLDFVDGNLTAAGNMMRGHEQSPGFKERVIERVEQLVSTLVAARDRKLGEEVVIK